MEIGVNLTFTSFFKITEKSKYDFFETIPSEALLKMLAHINSALYLQERSLKVQFKLLNTILRKQSETLKEEIPRFYHSQIIKHPKRDVIVFSRHVNLMFINEVLSSSFNTEVIDDTTPEQELDFLKAYLLFSEDLEMSGKAILNNRLEGGQLDFYRSVFWPMMGQVGSTYHYNPVIGSVKTVCMINQLKNDNRYEVFVRNYLNHLGVVDVWQIIKVFFEIVGQVWKDIDNGITNPFIKVEKDLLGAFEGISLGNLYEIEKRGTGSNYKIMEYPLMEITKGEFIVLDWDFFVNKIHDGFIFDFYKYSGISKLYVFPKFIPFKNFVGLRVVEQFIFRRFINNAFGKNTIIHFDEDNDKGFPDAYVRKGKYIFLFEVKDSLFSNKGIKSGSYQIIKNELDEKFNKKSKGVGQLSQQIDFLKSGNYENRDFRIMGLKRRNVVIYPILIYTDIFFQTPGFGYYLSMELRRKILNNGVNTFQEIKPLSFIGLNFILEGLTEYEKNRALFQKTIEQFCKEIKKREKSFVRNKSIENLNLLNDPFETIVGDKLLSSSKTFSKEIFRAFGLGDGLDE